MITLKKLLEVCNPDWIQICGKIIDIKKEGIPEGLLDFPVKDITGWDDGLTVELDAVIRPYPGTPTQKEGSHVQL